MIHKFKSGPEYLVPTSPCPVCGEVFNGGKILAFEVAEGTAEPRAPFPGAWGLCNQCGEVLVYNDALDLELPSDRMFAKLTTEQWEFMEKAQTDIRNRKNN